MTRDESLWIIMSHNKALIQISVYTSTGPLCYLFRICNFDISLCPDLIKILTNSKIIKLGVGIDGDVKKLGNEFSILKVRVS